jgi:AcrR family transcriptional regulator
MVDAGSDSGAVAATRRAILDAAHEAMLSHGVRRTTAADIARRSGVSRQTLYRYWPDITTLCADVLTRELLGAIPADAPGSTLDDLVAGLVDTAAHVRDLPLLRRLRETDPELFARYILERLGASQRDILRQLAVIVTASQSLGLVRAGDPDRLAAMVLLIVQSAVQSAPLVAEPLPPGAWEEELTRALRGYLAPEGS